MDTNDMVAISTAELSRLQAIAKAHRWNIEADGDVLVACKGDHDRGEKCEGRRYFAEDGAELSRLRAVEGAARALTEAARSFRNYDTAAVGRELDAAVILCDDALNLPTPPDPRDEDGQPASRVEGGLFLPLDRLLAALEVAEHPVVREAAEGMAREAYETARVIDHASYPWVTWEFFAGTREAKRYVEAHARLLTDLSRPASRDWWCRWGTAKSTARIRVAWGDTPMPLSEQDRARDEWLPLRDNPEALAALVLATLSPPATP
jgi:hypothetical protein